MRNQDSCPICMSSELNCLFEDSPIGRGERNQEPGYKIQYIAPVKNNPVVKKVIKRSYNLKVMQCKDCEHVFQYRVFDPDEEIEFVKEFFKDVPFDKVYMFDRFMFAEEALTQIKILNGIREFKTILDVGAAFGEFCFIAKSLKLDPYAYDICESSNNYLKQNSIKSYNNLDDIDKKFDVIRISHILSHLHNNPTNLISKTINLLKNDGILFISDHKVSEHASPSTRNGPLLHVNVYSEKSLKCLMSNFNDMVEIQNVPNLYETEDPFIIKWYKKILRS